MIDISKINVGDEVTVRARVIQIDRKHTAEPVRLNGGSWVLGNQIIAHHPKPREFKPGDRVTIRDIRSDKRVVGVILAIDDACAWVKSLEFPAQRWTEKLVYLRHADESE